MKTLQQVYEEVSIALGVMTGNKKHFLRLTKWSGGEGSLLKNQSEFTKDYIKNITSVDNVV